jgi:hypothetical protein
MPHQRTKRRRIRPLMRELMCLATLRIHTGRPIQLAIGFGQPVVAIAPRPYFVCPAHDSDRCHCISGRALPERYPCV